MRRIAIILGLIFISIWQLSAQKFNDINLAKAHIEEHLSEWNLAKADVNNIIISDRYQTKHNGVTHIYFQQRYQGIPIHNALTGIHVLPNGQTRAVGHRFIGQLEEKVEHVLPVQTPLGAIQASAKYVDLTSPNTLGVEKEISKQQFKFQQGELSRSPILVQLKYVANGNGRLLLSWEVQIDEVEADNYWMVYTDAITGELIGKLNQTIHCKFGESPYGHIEEHEGCNHSESVGSSQSAVGSGQSSVVRRPSSVNEMEEGVGTTYTVFALPVESPTHGDRVTLTDPADPVASPYGWHDVDGMDGAEFTTTRGNNSNTVWNRNNSTGVTGDEPKGGESLQFNFPYDFNNEPHVNGEAATTNLFYVTNFVHDFTYHYGFDEAAGNYQQKNYTGAGREGDPILAITQYGADIPSTPNDDNPNNDYINNANFTPLPDGSRGLTRMYAWNRAASGAKALKVESPLSIAGNYEADLASFGPTLTGTGINGQIAEAKIIIDVANDIINYQGCTVPDNKEELEGKIALIDRGTCDFSKKVFNAQEAGAVGAIICNFEDALIGGMGAGDNAAQVTIPSIFMKVGDCATLREFLAMETVTVNMLNPPISGPDSLDGSFDNGIIIHEYAHGISNRLTGGPNVASCLKDFDNDGEQMGEGWSDFFGLVATVKPSDTKETKRGIGTYVFRQDNNGQGVRDYAYSTNMSVNPVTYESIILDGIPYGTGSVWASALWDLYWAFVEEYDWSADLINGNKGNNIAIQLVMDAMKLQPCDPSMVDGRDALLMADEINNNGANACLIWEVFANRGIGSKADAADVTTRFDNTQSFDKLPSCVKTVKVEKSMTPLIEPGDDIEITIVVNNDKAASANGVTVTDEMPDGSTLLSSSVSKDFTMNGDMIVFDLGTMVSGGTDTIKYTVTSSMDITTESVFYDDMENGGDNWFDYFIEEIEDVANPWSIDDILANSGTKAWVVSDINQRSKAYLQFDQPIQLVGDQPAVRFFHQYDTEPGRDGGFVELSIDGGNTWFDARPYLIRNGYKGPITYTTFAIPNLRAFWGDSEEFVETYIDLTEFKGEELMMQFSFATDAAEGGTGWFVDDVEVLNLEFYNPQVCVTTTGGDNVCAIAPEKGTLVLPTEIVPTNEIEKLNFNLQVFPNPAQDILHLNINSTNNNTDYLIQLFGLDGKLMKEQNLEGANQKEVYSLSVNDLPAGFYFVKISSAEGAITEKVVIE